MIRFRALFIATSLASLGCLDTTGSNSISLPFDFTNPSQPIGEGWTAHIADVPADRVDDAQVVSGLKSLPSPFGAYTGIEQGATSVDGGVFVFHKKWIASPWAPGRVFTVSLDMTFMSNIAAGCTGGGGTSVYLKAGVSGTEPVVTTDPQGILRLNLDKGTGSAAGRFVKFGDITNGASGCPAEASWTYRETQTLGQTETLTVDQNGGFWIFIGTQSTFAGSHDIYLLGIRLRITPAEESP
jgi:hypothetical protein